MAGTFLGCDCTRRITAVVQGAQGAAVHEAAQNSIDKSISLLGVEQHISSILLLLRQLVHCIVLRYCVA